MIYKQRSTFDGSDLQSPLHTGTASTGQQEFKVDVVAFALQQPPVFISTITPSTHIMLQ